MDKPELYDLKVELLQKYNKQKWSILFTYYLPLIQLQ